MSLKVFDLQCANGHVFEGWFASRDAFEEQHSRGLLTCPVCGKQDVQRKLSAARINLGKSNKAEDSVAKSDTASSVPAMSVPASAELAAMQAKLLSQLRQAIRATENVGDRFVEEARRIHAGESEERPIRGIATQEDQAALLEEGIDVLPIPDFLDDDRLQ